MAESMETSNKTQTNIRLSEPVREALQKAAKRENRSMNQEVAKRLMDSLERDGFAF